MFRDNSFKVFDIAGLEPRMTAIRAEIQPIFQEIGTQMRDCLIKKFPTEQFYLHIAQHRRRTAYAPESTWCAISTQKRGYKMEAHISLTIQPDYVSLYLSIIDQPKKQIDYAKILQKIGDFPADFVLSKDHTKSDFYPISEFSAAVERLEKVKKAELEIGRVWKREKFDGRHDDELLQEMLDTLGQLLPTYQKVMAFKD